MSLIKHKRGSLRTTFVTNRTIVVKATLFVENILMDKLHSKASKYGNFHGLFSLSVTPYSIGS